MTTPQEHAPAPPLISLLNLAHQARDAKSGNELVFLLVNDSRSLLRYRQAVLWLAGAGVRGLSGVVEIDRNAPYAQWVDKVCAELASTTRASAHRVVDASSLPAALAASWSEWMPAHAVWVPLPPRQAVDGATAGGLLLASDEAWPDGALTLLAEWLHVWAHAWQGVTRARHWWQALLGREAGADAAGGPRRAWWRRRSLQLALALAVVALIPVRMTVLAPAELVGADAAVVRAPLDGVVDKFDVQPNQPVQKGQLLFSFDLAPIASRLDVARLALASASVEYRQAEQMALADPRNKGQLAVLQGKIEERRAEADYLEDQFQRSRVVSPRAGVAIFDNASEWQGRQVHTGERILRVVDPMHVEVEAWIAVGDAIPLDVGSPLRLYLASTPRTPVEARLRYMSHDPVQRPDGNYAYRVRAGLSGATTHDIGLKGTARLQAGWTPLAYWMLRRPLAIARQTFAL